MTDLATLTAAEVDYLAQCEETISHGLQTFIEVGTALAMIRDNRLYRAEHATFEAYCADRWGFTDRRARQLIDAAAIGRILPVANAGQAAELARVPEPERAEVWQQTVERTDGKPTAAAIRETYERTQSPAPMPEPEPEGVRQVDTLEDHPPRTGEADAPLDTADLGSAAVSEAPTGVAAPAGAGDPHRDGVGATDPIPGPTFGEVLDRLVPDDNPHREWQGNFIKALGGVNRLMLFTPAAVAEKADQQCLEELARLAEHFADWRARIAQERAASTPDNVTPIRRIS